MRTAVIISGHMRTFEICYPNQKWMVYRHYEPDIHFFVTCYDDLQADSAELLRKDYENVHIRRLKEPADLPHIPIEASYGSPHPCSVPNLHVVSQFWVNQEAWSYVCDRTSDFWFDTIIRIRPDLYFHRFIKPPDPKDDECYAPWWGKFSGMNDRFAIMGETSAHNYFSSWNQLEHLLEIGIPFHPETILGYIMRDMDVKSTLMTEFSTVRLNKDARGPEGEVVRKPEVVMADILELLQYVR